MISRNPSNRQTHLFIFLLILQVLIAAAFIGCGTKPLRPVPFHKLPTFTDDHTRISLKEAVARSINYLKKLPPDKPVTFSDTTYSTSWLIETLHAFMALLQQPTTPEELNQQILKKFEIYQARGSNRLWRRGEMLITGYFEPILDGSLTESPTYRYPLYGVPPDLQSFRDVNTDEKKIGRLENNQFVPYWTRGEIESLDLLAGRELVYLADPVEAFILHVQGSGKIRFRNGSLRGIHYAASNGRPYRSIGRLMVDEGIMSLDEVDLPRITQYLADHPEERDRILHHNESFIFFKWEAGIGPLGNLGEVLTAGRSVAADQDCFPAGALGFLQSQKPVLGQNGEVIEWVPLSRFVLVQDSGSAIKGASRLDLFWGNTHYAKSAAGGMKHPGKLYFLVGKQQEM